LKNELLMEFMLFMNKYLYFQVFLNIKIKNIFIIPLQYKIYMFRLVQK